MESNKNRLAGVLVRIRSFESQMLRESVLPALDISEEVMEHLICRKVEPRRSDPFVSDHHLVIRRIISLTCRLSSGHDRG